MLNFRDSWRLRFCFLRCDCKNGFLFLFIWYFLFLSSKQTVNSMLLLNWRNRFLLRGDRTCWYWSLLRFNLWSFCLFYAQLRIIMCRLLWFFIFLLTLFIFCIHHLVIIYFWCFYIFIMLWLWYFCRLSPSKFYAFSLLTK